MLFYLGIIFFLIGSTFLIIEIKDSSKRVEEEERRKRGVNRYLDYESKLTHISGIVLLLLSGILLMFFR